MELTPKEKAKELVEKFSDLEDGEMYIGKAKQCVLITLDEIMDVCPYIDEKIRENEDQLLAFSFQFVSYWQEVKEELLKM